MSDQVDPNLDPWGFLGIIRNLDGSLTRLPGPPETPASSDPSHNPFHLTKDIPLNQSKNTCLRIFIPQKSFLSSQITKLPVIIYFHAGGFVVFSPSASMFDDFYAAIVTEIPAIIVSVAYRLAPEHRLPAAYDDCFEALHWVKNSDDQWMKKYADITKCFLMGSTAGANISYNLGLRAAASADDLKPLEIKGLILHQAFFGGIKRTDSELRLKNDKVIPLCACDIMWELCLPNGADRDHPFCNPLVGMESGIFDRIKDLGWKVLGTGCYGDPLIDRQIEFVKKLEENGVSVVCKFEQGGYHVNDLVLPKVKELSKIVKEFVVSTVDS